MKKFSFVLLLIVPLFLFTSCFDYVQSITYKNGSYSMSYKMVVSKMLFAMANQDPESVFESFDVEAMEDLPENVEFKKIDTDLDVGIMINISVDPRTDDETEKIFLPSATSNKIYIPFLLGREEIIGSNRLFNSDDSDRNTQAYMDAFLSTAKSRIIVSKKIVSDVETAYFAAKDGENFPIDFYDYGDVYSFEIPFLVFKFNDEYRMDRIVIVKKE